MANPGFFERQASARRNTGLLIILFLTAVMLITLAVCLVGYFVTLSQSTQQPFHHWLLSSHGLITAGAVVALISTGSLLRWADLAGGGSRVARMVKARLIEPDTADPHERQLRNIVEEMAIASGVPVPELFVMEQEDSINAFVAGYNANEAVMVVTLGALTHLNRNELQGVVAHEFSHILNGDMRINVRLMALLAGILMIGQIGEFLVRTGFYSAGRRRLRSSHRDGRAQATMGLLGLALLIIGYVGVFFGRLIQAAVSRQREMLADASSVQFTRNPEGIGGALFKIGMKGGYLDATSHASDMNHMCFSEAARMKFTSMLASHPPLDERINAIQPGLMARLRSRLRDTQPDATLRPGNAANQQSARVGDLVSGFTATAADTNQRSPMASEPSGTEENAPPQTLTLSARVGTVSRQSEAFANQWLNQLPATFRTLLYTRTGAVQTCYALLLYHLPDTEQQQNLQLLGADGLLGPQTNLLDKLSPALIQMGEGAHFPVLELAMPALRKLDTDERQQLMGNVRTLASADRKITLFELALITFLEKHLKADAERAVPARYRSYKPVQDAISQLLGLFARAGTESAEASGTLFKQAMAGFSHKAQATQPADSLSLKELRTALATLSRLSPLLKPAVIDACAYCVSHDGKVATREYELMRLVADQLDCPMPPL